MARVAEGKLLERAAELDAIDTALEAGRSGAGRAVLIEGPAGIGKTSLLLEARTRAEACGAEVLMTRCGELEQDVAWGTARRLLGPAVRRRDADERKALLADAAGLAAPALGIATPVASPIDQAAVSHGLYWLVAGLAAERPVAVLVDDAHWTDDGSLRWLASLAAGVEGIAATLIVTVRLGEPGATRHALAALSAAPNLELLRPPSLSPSAIEQRIGDSLRSRPDSDFTAACHELTGGNPFLVEELLRHVELEGIEPSADQALRLERLQPAAVGRHVVLRLARLPSAATTLAQAVAVLRERADIGAAIEMTELDPNEVERAFGALVRAEVLADETPLRFIHPLVRAAVYDDLTALERDRLHRRAARILAAADAPGEEVAGHLLHTDPAAERWSRELLVEVGGELLSRGAPDEALRLLRRAEREHIEEAGDDLPLLLGRAAFAVLGTDGLDALRGAWMDSTGGRPRGEAALDLGRALHTVGNHPEAARVYEETLTSGIDHDLAERVRDELILTAVQDLATFPAAQAALAQTVERRAGGEPVSTVALATLALASAAVGDASALELAEGALGSGNLIAEPNTIPLSFAIAALLWSDEFERVRELWDEAIEAARRNGSRPWYSFCACFRAHVAWRLGELRDAEAYARDAVALADLWDLVPPEPAAYLADALLEQGRLEEAERTLAESGYDPALPERQGYNTLLFTRARLHLARGQNDAAIADLRELGRRLAAWGLINPAAFPWRSTLAVALAGAGEGEARALAAEELELARSSNSRRALGNALRAAGAVTPGDEGLDLLSKAAETLRDSPAVLDRARALTDLGAALRRSRHRREARGPLREALDLAHRCGAGALEQRAREELVMAGGRPRRPATQGQDSLTAAELRVARMAAEGLTNRQIGQALFVTPRTVETHLTHIYRKLEISSRTELAKSIARGEGASS